MDLAAALSKTYSPLKSKEELKRMIESVNDQISYQNYTKRELHEAINQNLMASYSGEAQLKYKLAQLFRNKKYEAGFEIRANNSRADFLAINGQTKCFEIKSERDNLSRLSEQLQSYAELFEYVYVVGSKSNEKEILGMTQQSVGVWIFDGKRKVEKRSAQLSDSLNPGKQLAVLTKKELRTGFGVDDISKIMIDLPSDEINQRFKATLKKRYKQRWDFVKDEWDNILPVDLQFFYNKNIKPNLIYSA